MGSGTVSSDDAGCKREDVYSLLHEEVPRVGDLPADGDVTSGR